MSKLTIESIDTTGNNVVNAIPIMTKSENVEIIDSNIELIEGYTEYIPDGEIPEYIPRGINNNIVIDMSTIHLYTDILRARDILNIKKEDILNLENKLFIEPPDNSNSEILKNVLDIIELEYSIGSKTIDVYSNDFKNDIIEMNRSKYLIYFITPTSKNITSITKAIQNSHTYPGRVILCMVQEDLNIEYDNDEMYEYVKVGQTILVNGSKFFMTIEDMANFLNNN